MSVNTAFAGRLQKITLSDKWTAWLADPHDIYHNIHYAYLYGSQPWTAQASNLAVLRVRGRKKP